MFNESANVAPLVDEIVRLFDAQPRPWELVLVDDHSDDDTWAQILAAQSRDPRVRGLRHTKNRGQSAAVWTGICGSDAPLLCTLDGDLQNDPAELPKMLSMLGEVDFVCGHRVERQDSFIRKVSSRVAGVSKYGVWNRAFRGLHDLVGVAWYQRRRIDAVPVDDSRAAR